MLPRTTKMAKKISSAWTNRAWCVSPVTTQSRKSICFWDTHAIKPVSANRVVASELRGGVHITVALSLVDIPLMTGYVTPQLRICVAHAELGNETPASASRHVPRFGSAIRFRPPGRPSLPNNSLCSFLIVLIRTDVLAGWTSNGPEPVCGQPLQPLHRVQL